MTQVLDEAMSTFRDEIAARRASIAQGWHAFRTDASPFHIAKVIDRDATGLPDDYVPWALGVVVAGDHLLKAAGYRPTARRPKGWKREHSGLYTKQLHNDRLSVIKCDKLWFIERPIEDTVLVYRYGSLPMATYSDIEAMCLGEFCHLPPNGDGRFHAPPRGAASPLTWVGATPSGIRYLDDGAESRIGSALPPTAADHAR